MTIQEALSNLEIAGLWPVSEAARKLWRDALLAVHVEACEVFHMKRAVTEYASSQAASKVRKCGHGWYCPKAKAIQEEPVKAERS